MSCTFYTVEAREPTANRSVLVEVFFLAISLHILSAKKIALTTLLSIFFFICQSLLQSGFDRFQREPRASKVVLND